MEPEEILLPVRDYNLAATLSSGQAFRWSRDGDGWVGVIGHRWLRLQQQPDGLLAHTCTISGNGSADHEWLPTYLQARVELEPILQTFPGDAPFAAAVAACRGLRLLRQDPWECLASFILSSTKQIVQIQQIVAALCARFGDPVPVPAGGPPHYSFPTAERIARVSEAALRACKMGFRAPYLLATARKVAGREIDLESLRSVSLDAARRELRQLPGVGEKIADCVLLFAYGFSGAFPVDVWVRKALLELYFPRRKPAPERLRRFIDTHFGPHAGYAQQYLFHYMRTRARPASGSMAQV